MPDLRLDSSTHDLELVNGDFKLTLTEDESLAQRLKVKLLTFQGEWFLDQNLGIPWYQRILGKNAAKETIDIIFQRAITEEPEVVSLRSYESNLDSRNRRMTISFVVNSTSDDEPIPIEIEL
ncbi:MAG: hypothetical protein CMF22_10635 [Idiomarinaceae bacterium]|nr:hypothetical protein [Idiomarinaceae bacterium]MBG23897.1 hypothetical protein [Idiomarinaceae bacterium]|tara:strand:+ start:5123 stop:5488 length:366 start_codon:yes stop_codon:yes gene_type:complete